MPLSLRSRTRGLSISAPAQVLRGLLGIDTGRRQQTDGQRQERRSTGKGDTAAPRHAHASKTDDGGDGVGDAEPQRHGGQGNQDPEHQEFQGQLPPATGACARPAP